jgi:hypothetical protein
MGRTNPTETQLIEAEQALWQPFRRALRAEDREVFDELWRYARYHAVPASMANRPVPFDGFLIAMLVGLALELHKLRLKASAQP